MSVVGVAGVDDERQPGLPRRGDVAAEDPLLHVARAVVIVIVEPRLADRDALAGARDRRAISSTVTSGSSAALCGCVPTVQNTLSCAPRWRDRLRRWRHRSRSSSCGRSPAAPASAKHLRAGSTAKSGKIEMAMAVDEHRLTGLALRLSPRIQLTPSPEEGRTAGPTRLEGCSGGSETPSRGAGRRELPAFPEHLRDPDLAGQGSSDEVAGS